MDALTKNNIRYIGAGITLEGALKSVSVDVKGLKYTFLAYTSASAATITTPGCAPLRRSIIIKEIRKYRKDCDYLIISLHHGIEYSDSQMNIDTPKYCGFIK